MNIEMIEAAAQRLQGHVRHTPLLSSPMIDNLAGRPVLIKPECLQHTGSFKARGAWAAISALPDDGRGVIAFSSGNHAQGVARAAAAFGRRALIVMPDDAPAVKMANTRALGAEIVLYDRAREDRDEIGLRLAEERDLVLIRPFDDPQVIAGQGTVGLELAAQAAEAGIAHADVLVPCGGGGLAAGIALALEARAPGLRLRPVEPEGFDDLARSLRAGRRLGNARASGSICDALLTPTTGKLTWPILERLAGGGLTVRDDEALRAVALAFSQLRLVVEPGGAVALAAVESHRAFLAGDALIVVLTGGNIDPAMMRRALAAAEGAA